MTCTKQRQYDININEIRKLDTMSQIYKVVIAGLIVAVFISYFFLGYEDKTYLYVMISIIFLGCLLCILLYILPKLNKDDYDHQIILYRRELSQDSDFYDMTVDEIIASASSE